ncbi:hypothetical protein KAR91_00830 [Candidatus Pacearchaeota archaeon]|nr:hypothetical protein [Candidatus Pacearchaeota archaeon]
MRTKKCWICGNEIMQSSIASIETYYGKIQIVNVYRPYAGNYTSKSVYICQKCMREKIGMSHEGENLNPIRVVIE